RAALIVVRGSMSCRACPRSRLAVSSSSTRASAWFAAASVLARTEIKRSDGPASGASAGHMPASASIERPGGVPIATPTSATPASCLACSATRMRSIESKYALRRTAQTKRILALRSSHYSESRTRDRSRQPGWARRRCSRCSPQADHHEAALLELVVDVPPLLLARIARGSGLRPGRQNPPVQKHLDLRHPGEDPLEVAEELRTVPGDHHDHPRQRSPSSGNLPNRPVGPFCRLAR